MPYVNTRANALRGTGRKTGTRRRHNGNSYMKVKYQRPTAKNQKKHILRNTKIVNQLAKIQLSKRVYTDWQYGGTLIPTATDKWKITPLTDLALWEPVLRQSENTETQTKTYIRNMSINLRFSLNSKDYVYMSVFIVTMRRNALVSILLQRILPQ